MRYKIVSDCSGHKYYIPVGMSTEWDEFMDIPDDDPRAWNTPDFARCIDGRFTFTDPRCD